VAGRRLPHTPKIGFFFNLCKVLIVFVCMTITQFLEISDDAMF
jgi:hypothetical protein